MSSPTRRPFGKPARSPPRMPEVVRGRVRRDRDVQPEHVGVRRAGVVLEPPAGRRRSGSRSAGSRPDRHGCPSSRRGSGTRRGRGRAGARPARDAGRSAGTPRRRRGCSWFQLVLLAERDDHLVEERVAEPRDLHPGAGLRGLHLLVVEHARLAAARRTPDRRAPTSGSARRRRRLRAVLGQHRDRDLDRDRVDVQRLRRVDAGRRRQRDQVRGR